MHQDEILMDLGIDDSAFTIDIGGGEQPWSQYVWDSRDFGELPGVDFSSFEPQAFGPADLNGLADLLPAEYPMSGEVAGYDFLRGAPGSEYVAEYEALTVDPTTGTVYQYGVPVLPAGILQQAMPAVLAVSAELQKEDAAQAKRGVRPEERTIPGRLGAKIYDLKAWLDPLTSQLGGGGAAGEKTSLVGKMLMALLVGGVSIGISEALKGGDQKLVVPQGGTGQVTAAGNRAVMGALTEPGAGGGAAGADTGGIGAGATGMENLQRAIQAALAGQKDLAIYYAEAAQKEIEMARTALGGMPAYLNPTPETLTAAGDPVSAGLLTRLQNVFAGKVSNPVLENEIVLARDRAHNAAMAGRPPGGGEASDSRTQELWRKQALNEAILRDADYRQSVAQIVPLYNVAAGQGLATRKLFAAPSQGPLASVASIPQISGIQSADVAAAAQASREFQAALAAMEAQSRAGSWSGDIKNLGMLAAGGMLFGRG